ncbi:hypothetical protein A3715_17170 [Oleiphilus sp. HI0009]|nr:hypothetical protein A3715_17170 [Oleiphilus sp. HI0009]
MDLLTRNKALVETVNPSSLFTPLASEDISNNKEKRPIFYLDDNYVGFGVKTGTLAGCDSSTSKRLSQLLAANWPTNTIIQFNLYASPDIYDYTRIYKETHTVGDPILNELTEKRVQHFINASKTEIDKRSKCKLRDFVLFITVKIPIINFPLTDNDKSQINELIDTTVYTLQALNLYKEGGNQIVDEEDLCRFMQTILNWDDYALWRNKSFDTSYDPDKYVRDSFFDFGNRVFREDHSSLQLGEKHIGVMSVKEYPQMFCLADMIRLLGDVVDGLEGGLTTNFLMTQTIIIPDREKERVKLESKKQKNNYQALSQMSNWVPKLLEIKKDFDTVSSMLEEGDKLVKTNLTVSIFGDDKQEVDSFCSSIKSYWEGFDFRFLKDSYFSLPIFLNQLPFNAEISVVKKMWRYRTMTTRQAAQFIPCVTEWRGGLKPALLFNTRLGSPMFIDLFDTSESYSCCVIAQSGSGKSFVTNYIASAYMGMPNEDGAGAKVWIIDCGGSYKRLCELFDGNYIDYDDDTLKTNPFEKIQDFKNSSEMLLGIITVMAGKEGLNDLQSAEVRKVIQAMYVKHGSELVVDHIAAELCENQDPEIRRVGRQLHPFTSKGEYGQYFDGKSNVDLDDKQFTVVELLSLKNKPLLQSAVLFIVMYSITQAMSNLPKNVKKLVILDEAWQLLGESEEVGKFMENLYRTVRKLNGSAIVVTQSIEDLYSTPSGVAIASNTPTKFFLNQDKATVKRAQDTNKISLEPYAFDLLSSVVTQKGYYSEIFINKSSGYGVARFVVDRYTQLLFTTDPDEAGGIERISSAYSIPQYSAINKYIEHEKIGDLKQFLSSLPKVVKNAA